MKLKDWADKQGISYLTAWRWFKARDSRLAGAYQSDSGTIIVPDDKEDTESVMQNNTTNNDIMSAVLKKTVELSKTNSSVEEFAAWILSNYTLKPLSLIDGPKYSKNKPKPEQVQEHFKQFLKPNVEKPKVNMFLADQDAMDDLIARSNDLTTQELVDEIHQIGRTTGVSINPAEAPEVSDLMKDLSSAIDYSTPSVLTNSVKLYGDSTGGIVMRSADLTPQQSDYTGSANCNYVSGVTLGANFGSNFSAQPATSFAAMVSQELSENNTLSFSPTQKEIDAIKKVASVAPADVRPKKRGRPSKGKKQ